jgi:predicted transcriptional regulator
MKTLKHEIIRYLKQNKLRPYHLAKKAKISPSILSFYLRDMRSMSLKTAEKIIKVIKNSYI